MADINDQYLQNLRVALYQFTRESSNFTQVLTEVFDNLGTSSKKTAKQYEINTKSAKGFGDAITSSSNYLKDFQGYVRTNNKNIAESSKALKEYAEQLENINKRNKDIQNDLKGFSESLKNSTNANDSYMRSQMIAIGKSTVAFDMALSKQNDIISEAFADILNPVKTLLGLKEYDAVKKELLVELKKTDGIFNDRISELGKKLQNLGTQMGDSALLSMGHIDTFSIHLGKALSLYEAGIENNFSNITDELERSTEFTSSKIEMFGDSLEELMNSFEKSNKTFSDVKKFYEGANGLEGLKDLMSVLEVNNTASTLKFDELIKDFDKLGEIATYIKEIGENNGEITNAVQQSMDGILNALASGSIASSILLPLKDELEKYNIQKDIPMLADKIYNAIYESNGILSDELIANIEELRTKQQDTGYLIPEFEKLYTKLDKIKDMDGGLAAAVSLTRVMEDFSVKEIKESQDRNRTLIELVSGRNKLKEPVVDISIDEQLSKISGMAQSITTALNDQITTVLNVKNAEQKKLNDEISANNLKLYNRIYDTVGGSLLLIDNLIVDKTETWKGLRSNINDIAKEAFKDTSIAISDDFYKNGIAGLHDFNKAMAKALIELEKNNNNINDSNVAIIEKYVMMAEKIGNTSAEIGIINDKLNEYAKMKMEKPSEKVSIVVEKENIDKMVNSSDATIAALDKFSKSINKTFTRHQIALSTIIDKQLSEQSNAFGRFIYNFGRAAMGGGPGGGGPAGIEAAFNEFNRSMREGLLPSLQSIAVNSRGYITEEAQALYNAITLDREASLKLQEGDSETLKKLAGSKDVWSDMAGGIKDFTNLQLSSQKALRDVIGVDAGLRTKVFVDLEKTFRDSGILNLSSGADALKENADRTNKILYDVQDVVKGGMYSQEQTVEMFRNTVKSSDFLKVASSMDKKRRAAQAEEVMNTLKLASALHLSTEAAQAFAIASATAGANLSPQQMITNVATTLKSQNILDYYAKQLNVKPEVTPESRAKMEEIEKLPAAARTTEQKEFFNEYLLKSVIQEKDIEKRLTELMQQAAERGDVAAQQQYAMMFTQFSNQFETAIGEYTGSEKEIIATYMKNYSSMNIEEIKKSRKEGETLTQAMVRTMSEKKDDVQKAQDTRYDETIKKLAWLSAQWEAFTKNIIGSNILAFGTVAAGLLGVIADFSRVAAIFRGTAAAGAAASTVGALGAAEAGAAATVALPAIMAVLGTGAGIAMLAYGAKGLFDHVMGNDVVYKADRGQAIHGMVEVNNLDIYTNQVTDAIDAQTKELLKGFTSFIGNSDNIKNSKEYASIPTDIKKIISDSKNIQEQIISNDKERYATFESLLNDSKGPNGLNFGVYDINDDEKIQKYIEANKIDTKQLYNKEELSTMFKDMFGDNKEHIDRVLNYIIDEGVSLTKGLEQTQRQAALLQAQYAQFPDFFKDVKTTIENDKIVNNAKTTTINPPSQGLKINPYNGGETVTNIEQNKIILPSDKIKNSDINLALDDLKDFLTKQMIDAMLSKFDSIITNTGTTAKNTSEEGVLGGLVDILKPTSQPYQRGPVENAASMTR